MAKQRQRDFRYIVTYLEENPPQWPPVLADHYAAGIGCLATFALAPLLPGLAWLATQNPFAALGGVLLAPVGGWLAAHAVKRRAPKIAPEERQHMQEQAEAAQSFADLAAKKKLVSWVDPLMLQLLEAAAYHHYRVKAILTGPAWPKNDSGQRGELGRQAMRSADEGMRELLTLCVPCIGKPPKEKKDDLEDIAQDFVNLNFTDALQSLQRVATATSAGYAYRSPHTQAVFPSCRAIAERIKLLADELEKMPTTQSAAAVDLAGQPSSTHSMDLLLGELKAVREAEEELEQRTTG